MNGPRCSATTKAGKPCQALAGSDGLCSAHRDPERMRELDRRGGKASGGVKPEQVAASLREELRKLDPSIVRGAIEQALAGGNESARVSAVKLLADIDAFSKDGDEEDRARAMAKAGAEARAHLARELAQRARVHEQDQVRDLIEELAAWLEAEAVDEHPDLVVGDVGSERAAAVLAQMEEQGLIVGRDKVEELAEQKAQARLQALMAEHGIPAP